MNLTVEEYLDWVVKEIEGIKTHATDSQKAKLDFSELDPLSPYSCIYGQMTGNCYSQKAKDLIKAVNVPLLMLSVSDDAIQLPKPKYRFNKDRESIGFTALEHFINNHLEYNKRILAYIKGELVSLPKFTISSI